ncbi:MAG: SpoIIE family protein phosphatase [Bdellovibrio sp.]
MNRVLRRNIKKYLNLEGSEDLEHIHQRLLELAESPDFVNDAHFRNFAHGLTDFVNQIGRGFDEYDRVLKARETSLEVNDIENVRLVEQLQSGLSKREQVLNRLQEALETLKEDNTEVDSLENIRHNDELIELALKVEALLSSHRSRSRELELIHRESLKISTARSFDQLSRKIEQSVQELSEESVQVAVFFHLGLLDPKAKRKDLYRVFDDPNRTEKERLSVQEVPIHEVYAFADLLVPVLRTGEPQPSVFICVWMGRSNARHIQSVRFVKLLQTLSTSILSACESIQNLEFERNRVQIESDLATAYLVQQTLIPTEKTIVQDRFLISSWMQTAQNCGGDWWGYYHLRDGRHLILIGDVTGHGTASALMTAVVRGYCDAVTSRSNFDLESFFVSLNDEIFFLGRDGSRCMSMLALLYNPVAHEMRFFNAGHPAAYQPRAQKDHYHLSGTQSSGALLAVWHHPWSQKSSIQVLPVHPRDRVILFTDGLIENQNASNIDFGEGRLERLLRKIHMSQSGEDILNRIQQAHREFLGSTPPMDDTTLVVIDFFN